MDGRHCMKSILKRITHKLEIECTCGECPEQYDVYFKGKKSGYIRLRSGYFSVTYPDALEKLLYSHQFENKYMGTFDNQDQRDWYLIQALLVITKEIAKEQGISLD